MLFFKPVFVSKPWGGDQLKDLCGFAIKKEKVGEAWVISAIPGFESEIIEGKYQGKTLSYLWDNHRELFHNHEGKEFPLLLKILDAQEDLSIQVHPNDEYARNFENKPYGKSECWYFLKAHPSQKLIIGHKAKNKKQLTKFIKTAAWKKLLKIIKVSEKDVFDIKPGTVHALCAGSLVYELQQSSDITYRLYDYDRPDKDGKLRDLHIDKSIDVISTPQSVSKVQKNKCVRLQISNNTLIRHLIHNQYYSLFELKTSGDKIQLPKLSNYFLMVTVLDNPVIINNKELKPFSSCLITKQDIDSGIIIDCKNPVTILIGTAH